MLWTSPLSPPENIAIVQDAGYHGRRTTTVVVVCLLLPAERGLALFGNATLVTTRQMHEVKVNRPQSISLSMMDFSRPSRSTSASSSRIRTQCCFTRSMFIQHPWSPTRKRTDTSTFSALHPSTLFSVKAANSSIRSTKAIYGSISRKCL